jgi:hypothetical protein
MRSAVGWLALAVVLLLHCLSTPVVAQRGSTLRGRPAPADTSAAPRIEPAVPFKVGETLNYDVSWTSFLVAGSAVVSVKEKRPSNSSTAYYIVAEGRPIPLLARLYSLYYKMDTLFDAYSLLSQRGALYAEEGSDHRTATTRFDRPLKRVFFEEQSDKTTKVDYAVPLGTQDGLATLYGLRVRSLKAGDHLTIPVADSGSLYNVQMTVGGPERVRVGIGESSAWSLKGFITDMDGQPVWDNIAVWISADARRLPVKMQADLPVGAFVLALREAH